MDIKKSVIKPNPSHWGNSFLFVNVKFWKCDYCGLLIKDKKKFCVVMINGNPQPYVLCTPLCLKLQVMKIEATHVDSDERVIVKK